ncbi:MAG: hypothetical protein H7321_07705 [Bacteroidia bacterium]|nr:hypothetical protein [Bacteroidia bacterium]
MGKNKKTIGYFNIIILNLLPVLGVFYQGWTIFYIVYLFWFESLILSFFIFFKIIFANKDYQDELYKDQKTESKFTIGIRYLLIRIGVLVFYLIFILAFIAFAGNENGNSTGDVIELIAFMNPSFNIVALLFSISLLIDFVFNYIISGVSKKTDPHQYSIFDSRTLILHIVIVLGAVIYSNTKDNFQDNKMLFIQIYLSLFIVVKVICEIILTKYETVKEV